MTVTLGAITLSDNLVLSGLESSADIVINQRRTLSGNSVVQTGPMIGGRTLTLQGEDHFTLSQIQAVKAMATLGQPVILKHHRGTFTVLIIGTPVEPTFDHANPDVTAWHSGEITLLEV